MNWAHVHLIINHIPVIGVPIAFAVLAWGWGRRSKDVMKLGLMLITVISALTIAVYFSGEPAEEVVEGVAGVSESVIEEHEEAALFAAIGVSVVGILALSGLVAFRDREISPRYTALLLTLTLVTTVILARTANLGGEIRHSEIRAQTVAEASSLEMGHDGPIVPEDR